MSWQKFGEWAFFACVIIAVLGGLFIPNNGFMMLVLVILGIIVGIINITEKETTPYLIATIALIAAGTAGFEVLDNVTGGLALGTRIDNTLNYISIFVAPAAVIVALKAIWGMAKSK